MKNTFSGLLDNISTNVQKQILKGFVGSINMSCIAWGMLVVKSTTSAATGEHTFKQYEELKAKEEEDNQSRDSMGNMGLTVSVPYTTTLHQYNNIRNWGRTRLALLSNSNNEFDIPLSIESTLDFQRRVFKSVNEQEEEIVMLIEDFDVDDECGDRAFESLMPQCQWKVLNQLNKSLLKTMPKLVKIPKAFMGDSVGDDFFMRYSHSQILSSIENIALLHKAELENYMFNQGGQLPELARI